MLCIASHRIACRRASLADTCSRCPRGAPLPPQAESLVQPGTARPNRCIREAGRPGVGHACMHPHYQWQYGTGLSSSAQARPRARQAQRASGPSPADRVVVRRPSRPPSGRPTQAGTLSHGFFLPAKTDEESAKQVLGDRRDDVVNKASLCRVEEIVGIVIWHAVRRGCSSSRAGRFAKDFIDVLLQKYVGF